MSIDDVCREAQALGVPIISGRDFDDSDRKSNEPVVIISESIARRMFPTQDAVNHHMMWTDPVLKFIDISGAPRRIVGVVADIDDTHVVPGPTMTVYHPMGQEQLWGGRLFVHTHSDPYALVTPVTRIIRTMAADQPVEHPASLEDVRAEVMTPDRLNTFVFGGFALVALAIAVVGVAGVLAFSVSGRTREFGIRLAVGSHPRHLLTGVIAEGMVMAGAGPVALPEAPGIPGPVSVRTWPRRGTGAGGFREPARPPDPERRGEPGRQGRATRPGPVLPSQAGKEEMTPLDTALGRRTALRTRRSPNGG